ncbi:MAG: signal peptidase I [Candidatus Hydrogenedentes bacterium]|nr:signal peptidase I [Candidatus Hydrogenedentota bacterium]
MTPTNPLPEASAPHLPASSEAKREAVAFVKTVAGFLLLFFVLRTFVIDSYEVQGASMEPTLTNGESILVLKLPHVLSHSGWFDGIEALKPGDIVVFKSKYDADARYVKRVVAKGPKLDASNTVIAGVKGESSGEQVSVAIKTQQLFVNNRLVEEDYLPSEVHERFLATDRDETNLRAGEYYVLGDNRCPSKDSRSFGPVDDQEVIGKAILRFWPLSKFGVLK